MGAPSAPEEAIYASLVKDQRCRIAVTVDYKAWTADWTADFSGPLTKADWQWSPGAKPAVHDGSAWITAEGAPAFMCMRTRDHCFPEDPAIPFRARVRFKFPTEDPVYANGFVFGAINGSYGPVSDTRVLQAGLVDVPNGGGDLGIGLVSAPGQIQTVGAHAPEFAFTYDAAEHKVEVEWDPGNTPQYRLLVDDVEVFTSDDEEVAPRPVYMGFGYATFVEAYIPVTDPPEAYEPPGLVGSPVDLIEIIEVTVEAMGGGHETVVFPDWTTPDTNKTLITAAEGERFELLGRVCAKPFMGNVISARVTKDKSSEFDTFEIRLALASITDPDAFVNLYRGTRWDAEPNVLIDTRVSDDAAEPNWTDWRRQIAGRVWKSHVEYGGDGTPHLLISGVCIALAQLGCDASLAFIKATEPLPGIFTNLTFTEVFEAMLDEAANLDGDEWAPTHNINAPDIIPEAIGTGGQMLLSAFNDWADRLGQSRRVVYGVSGDAEFGQVKVHLQTIGGGTPDYGLRGLGGDYEYPVIGASRDDDRRQAPGQVQYHPNLPRTGWLDIATYGQPGVMVYPAFPYPANTPGWSDSIPYTEVGMHTLNDSWPDKAAVAQFGGPARHRLRGETVRAQSYSMTVIGRDHCEPDDEVYFNDPDGTGYVGTIILDRVEIEYAGLKLTSRLSGFATDPAAIMLRRR